MNIQTLDLSHIDWNNILYLSYKYSEQETEIRNNFLLPIPIKRKSKKSRLLSLIKKRHKQKKILFEQQGNNCFYCQTFITYNDLQREHVRPIIKGGTHTIENIVLSCNTCNQDKKDYFVLDFVYERLSPINIILVLKNLCNKTKKIKIKKEWKKIIHHALGINPEIFNLYRNYYFVRIGSENYNIIQEMVKEGLMKPGVKINNDKDQYFHVTEKGVDI